MAVTKEHLEQYTAMKIEIMQLRLDIRKAEDSIAKLIEEGTVKDKVYGGDGGIQGFVIEGFPEKEYNRRLKILRNKRKKLVKRESDLLELTAEMEKMISELPTSRDRIVFRGLFLEGCTQEQVARVLHIDRSLVSKIVSKYV